MFSTEYYISSRIDIKALKLLEMIKRGEAIILNDIFMAYMLREEAIKAASIVDNGNLEVRDYIGGHV